MYCICTCTAHKTRRGPGDGEENSWNGQEGKREQNTCGMKAKQHSGNGKGTTEGTGEGKQEHSKLVCVYGNAIIVHYFINLKSSRKYFQKVKRKKLQAFWFVAFNQTCLVILL